jgi:hypothetical protein
MTSSMSIHRVTNVRTDESLLQMEGGDVIPMFKVFVTTEDGSQFELTCFRAGASDEGEDDDA